MAETTNIAAIAGKIQNDIFRVFHWELHAQEDTNFDCVCDTHLSEEGAQKNHTPAMSYSIISTLT